LKRDMNHKQLDTTQCSGSEIVDCGDSFIKSLIFGNKWITKWNQKHSGTGQCRILLGLRAKSSPGEVSKSQSFSLVGAGPGCKAPAAGLRPRKKLVIFDFSSF